MPKKFIRTIEDFTCEHCGKKTKGNGYTNHCPQCLWSKHVDFYPGDRENPCGGIMEPVGLELKKDQFHIVHKCQICGAVARCKSSPADNVDALTKLSESIAKKTLF
jgi:transcription elongation factor Elf1